MRRSTLIIIVVAVVVLTLAVGAFLLFRQMNSIPKPDAAVGTATTAVRPAQSGKVTNLLLVCVDGRDRTKLAPFLGSDGILVMTINEGARKLVMTSFAAQTQVKVSRAYDDTLDHVFSDGGVELLKKTLSENFGLLPEHYAVMKDSDLQALSGASSLRELGLSELTALAKSLASKADTDMSKTDLLGFAMNAADMKSYKTASLGMPAEGCYETGELDGRTVRIPDLEACAELLEKTLYE